jgi:hypothetical protein
VVAAEHPNGDLAQYSVRERIAIVRASIPSQASDAASHMASTAGKPAGQPLMHCFGTLQSSDPSPRRAAMTRSGTLHRPASYLAVGECAVRFVKLQARDREYGSGAPHTGAITHLVSHQLSTVRIAGFIIVMSAGTVLEFGGHHKLMNRKASMRAGIGRSRVLTATDGVGGPMVVDSRTK